LNHFLSSATKMLGVLARCFTRTRGTFALAVIALVSPTLPAHAQSYAWTWINGSNVFTQKSGGETGQPGVYGTLGEPASANVPGGRLGAVSWTDKNGNFWLFGGGGLDSAETFGLLNDLWEFTPSTGEWTWIAGGNTIPAFNGGNPGVYGQKGVAAAANTPGSRTGAFGWTDSDGNLWLFGGAGFDGNASDGSSVNLNDLWKFDVATRQWAWIDGSSTLGANGAAVGVYGPLGSLTAGSYPGSRNFGTSWTDNKGNLWLFGGEGEGAALVTDAEDLNDLWEFVPSTKQWAWMGGSSATQQAGVYGTLGTFAAANVPGARSSATAWADKNGNFWLFAGNGFVQIGSMETNGFLNDLWEFNPSTQEWAWMGGSNTLPTSCLSLSGGNCSLPGVYGTQGTASAGNMPGSRAGVNSWTDQSGNLWLFGGIGWDSNDNGGFLNDLWKFNPTTNEWTWVAGNNTANMAGVYGAQGTPAPANVPGGRDSAVSWIDTNGNLWLFGGNGLDAHGAVNANGVLIVGYLNDLWEYQPLPTATPTFSPVAGTYTSVQSVTLSDTTPNATIYYTTDGTTPTTSSEKYTGVITVSATETIKAVATATGYPNSTVASATYTINLPLPPIAVTPTFSPVAGTYTSAQNVTISDTTTGAAIYYTTDGTTPTVSSAKYAGAITVSTTEAIEAIAVATGYTNSTVASAAYTINLPPPSFTFTASATSLTVNSGSQGVITLTVASQNGFDSPVSFSCAGLSVGASCAFSPATITPSSAGTKTQLTIATSTQSSALDSNFLPLSRGIPLTLAVSLLWFKRRRKLWSMSLLAVAFIGMGVVTACGSGNRSSSSPAPVTSTVTLNATSGSLQQSTTISLTVN
jgi:N-acetylneuraminic acid mutarotase